MNTIFNKRFFAIVSLFAMLFIASSCEDVIGIQVTPEAPNADKTLYDVIVSDPELTDFVEVLDACNIPSEKNPEVIVSVADSLFNTSRVYTVWAPVNGTFNKDSILGRVNDGYRDDVFKTFICSHVANFLKPAKGRFDEKGQMVLMLNNKKFLFEGSYKPEEGGYKFAGNKLASVNDRVKNGIIHKLETVADYRYNIWEYIYLYSKTNDLYKVDSLVNYLYSYNDTVFAEHLSIPGPPVNGAETYLDSVFEFKNELLNVHGGVGNLDNEDSLYTFYMPTNDAWDAMLVQAKNHFQYLYTQNTDTALVDSLQEYFPRYNLIKYLTYSDNEQKFVDSPDSMMPAQRRDFPRKKNFARADIEKDVVESYDLSNGTLKIVNRYPYSIFDLWHDTIKIEAENIGLIDETATAMTALKTYYVYEKDMNKVAGEKLSGNGYIVFGDEANNKTDITFYVRDVKSAYYQVALVFVPRNVSDTIDVSKDKKIKLECYVKCMSPATQKIENVIPKQTIYPALDRIDTLVLSETVKFPICEYNISSQRDDYTTKIQIKGNNLKAGNSNTIRLDQIILIPIADPVSE